MTDPLVNRFGNMLAGYVYTGDVEAMSNTCISDSFDGIFKAHGSFLVTKAMEGRPLNMERGLEARNLLIRKIAGLGVDLTKCFVDEVHGVTISDEVRAKASTPAAMLRSILNAPERNPRLYNALQNLDDFLVTIPVEVIRKNKRGAEAFQRRFAMTQEPDLLSYASNKQKASVLSDELGI